MINKPYFHAGLRVEKQKKTYWCWAAVTSSIWKWDLDQEDDAQYGQDAVNKICIDKGVYSGESHSDGSVKRLLENVFNAIGFRSQTEELPNAVNRIKHHTSCGYIACPEIKWGRNGGHHYMIASGHFESCAGLECVLLDDPADGQRAISINNRTLQGFEKNGCFWIRTHIAQRMGMQPRKNIDAERFESLASLRQAWDAGAHRVNAFISAHTVQNEWRPSSRNNLNLSLVKGISFQMADLNDIESLHPQRSFALSQSFTSGCILRSYDEKTIQIYYFSGKKKKPELFEMRIEDRNGPNMRVLEWLISLDNSKAIARGFIYEPVLGITGGFSIPYKSEVKGSMKINCYITNQLRGEFAGSEVRLVDAEEIRLEKKNFINIDIDIDND